MDLNAYFQSYLPHELQTSLQLEFSLHNELVQSLANSSSNDLFSTFPTPTGGRIGLAETGGSWNVLPEVWRNYFDPSQWSLEERQELLLDLALSRDREDFPTTLRSYLASARNLSLERTCSNEPLLSYPPSSSPRVPHSLPRVDPTWHKLPLSGRGKRSNAEREGLSQKKGHEVTRFSDLLKHHALGPPIHVIDVGAGCGHLSRALASPPHNLHVLALDWSVEQTERAALLNQKHPTLGNTASSDIGSLTHQTSALDSEGLVEVMKSWPEGTNEKAMLICLHACGDLTVDAMRAFISMEKEKEEKEGSKRKAILVGCCYNLLTPTEFPLSEHFRTQPLSRHPITLSHLRISPQTPQTWHLNASHTHSLSNAITTLLYRARLQAELQYLRLSQPHLFPNLKEGDTFKVGRIGIARLGKYEEYREIALRKLRVEANDVEVVQFGESMSGGGELGADWEEARFLLQVWWTLRCLMGPVIESMIILDRFCFLIEGMREEWEESTGGEKRRVELYNIFDQETGSLRNMAIVVQ